MYIKSPLNYIGGKYKLLSKLLPLFPSNINTFVDLFTGGANIAVNVEASNIIANDQLTYVIDMYKYFQNTPIEIILQKIQNRIEYFQLDQQNNNGYIQLRHEYNNTPNALDLFILTCFSFNHQIRFNNKHQFNTPFGKERSSFNASIEKNLIQFCSQIREKNINFLNLDFIHIDMDILSNDDFVYCDPPYLISTGSYNDGNRGFKNWTEKEEYQLLELLDFLNNKNIKFALSNVLFHKEKSNLILIEWAKKYHINFIDNNYKNCSYQLKGRSSNTVEVLITNYIPKKEYILFE